MKRGTASMEIRKMDAILGVAPEEDGDYLVDEKDRQVYLLHRVSERLSSFSILPTILMRRT